MKHPIHIESLETRIAPAGLVLADYNPATGELMLDGDADANQVSIFRTGASTFRIEGIDGTQIAGADFLDTGKITSLVINLGEGDDELTLRNLSVASADVNLGSGNDSLQADSFVVRGDTNLNYGDDGGDGAFGGPVTTLGSLSITSTSGSSQTNFDAAATAIKGALSLTGSVGSDGISGTGNLSFAKGLVVNGNGGDDALDFDSPGSLLIGKSSAGPSIHFIGGTNSDRIFLGKTFVTLAGFIHFDGGNGSNLLTMGSQSVVKVGTSTTGTSIFYEGGDGDDTLEGIAFSTTLAGGIDMNGGVGGANVIEFDSIGNVKIGKIKASGISVLLKGGADSDEIFLGGNLVTLAGGISLEAGAGSNTLDLDGSNVVVGTSREGQALSFAGANGSDSLDIEGGRVTLKGELFFVAAGGADQANISDLSFFSAPSILFEGGDDDDSFELDTHIVNIAGPVDLLGGGGNDDLSFFGDGTVKGNLTMDVETGTADQFMSVTSFSGLVGNLKILGALSMFSFGSTLSFDDVFVQDVSVGKITGIDLGDGGSFVTLDNLFARGEVDIQTHLGSDTVFIERFSAFGPSLLSKPVTVDLGAGNDTLRIGDGTVEAIATHNLARFLAAVTLNGGDGSDTVNTDLQTANSFAIDPTVTGFE